SYSSYGQS
nr:Chain A, FUS [Homo sapiens]